VVSVSRTPGSTPRRYAVQSNLEVDGAKIGWTSILGDDQDGRCGRASPSARVLAREDLEQGVALAPRCDCWSMIPASAVAIVQRNGEVIATGKTLGVSSLCWPKWPLSMCMRPAMELPLGSVGMKSHGQPRKNSLQFDSSRP